MEHLESSCSMKAVRCDDVYLQRVECWANPRGVVCGVADHTQRAFTVEFHTRPSSSGGVVVISRSSMVSRLACLLAVMAVAGYESPTLLRRRAVLAASIPTLYAARKPAGAAELPLPGGGAIPLPSFESNRPSVDLLSTPSICQGRCRDQDFIVVRYVGRSANGGAVFDDRYERQSLTFELGSFYLPGVDAALEGACVGSKFRLTWPSSPALGPDADAELPRGPIELELELVTIKYSLFGEKMRNATNTYWFNPEPLSLTSAVDARGHLSSREPIVKKDNPFSIAPGEKSIISNPSSVLGPLFKGFF